MGDVTQGNAYLQLLLDSMAAVTSGRAESPSTTVVILLAQISYITGTGDLFDIVQDGAQASTSSLFDHPSTVFLGQCSLALLAVQQGDVSRSGELYAALAPRRVTFVSYANLAMDRVLGLLCQTMGNPDQAVDHFEDSLAFCRMAGYRSELAWSYCDYADTLLQRNNPGDQEKAQSLLDRAFSWPPAWTTPTPSSGPTSGHVPLCCPPTETLKERGSMRRRYGQRRKDCAMPPG